MWPFAEEGLPRGRDGSHASESLLNHPCKLPCTRPPLKLPPPRLIPTAPSSPRSSESPTHGSPGHRPLLQIRLRPNPYSSRHRLPASFHIHTYSRLPIFARHAARSSRIPPKPAQRIHHRPLAARWTIPSHTLGQWRAVEQPPAILQTAQLPSQSQLRPIDAVSRCVSTTSESTPRTIPVPIWRREYAPA